MQTYNSVEQLSENPSTISEISVKQQQNQKQLKHYTDFINNLLRDNNLSINDNPSVESKIMDTPQRSDVIAYKSGQERSQVSPRSQRTYQEDHKKGATYPLEDTNSLMQETKSNKRQQISSRKYDIYEEDQRGNQKYSTQYENQQYEYEEEDGGGGTRGNSNLESQNDFGESSVNQGDYHAKGKRVINTIDNLFNQMKQKYNIFPLNEIQKHIIKQDTAGNSENTSSQNIDLPSQEDISQNPSLYNEIHSKRTQYKYQSQQQQQQQQAQEVPTYDFEANPDSVIKQIRDRVKNNMGGFQGTTQFDMTSTSRQMGGAAAQTLEQKERQLELKKNEIKKKLSPDAESKNPFDEIDDHNANLEIEKIKNKFFNRNLDSQKQHASPFKNDQLLKRVEESSNTRPIQSKVDTNSNNNQDASPQIGEEESKKEAQQERKKVSNAKHPIYSQVEENSSDDNMKNKTNNMRGGQQKNNQIPPLRKDSDVDKESRGGKGDTTDKVEYSDQNNSKQSQKTNSTSNKIRYNELEDESIKALGKISKNPINFKENMRKLKQMYKKDLSIQKNQEEEQQDRFNQQQTGDRNEEYNNHLQNRQDFRIQTQSDYYQDEDNNLEYSHDQQRDGLFPTLNPYNHNVEFVSRSENPIISPQTDLQSQRKYQQYNDNHQFTLSGDEGGDMDSEVFNISPDHHANRINSLPDDNRTLSIFNENQSLQASFLEQSIFQRSPRYIQSGNNSAVQQQLNKKSVYNPSPSPILINQSHNIQSGAAQQLQDSEHTSILKNTFNHQQKQKNTLQGQIEAAITTSDLQSQNSNSSKINNLATYNVRGGSQQNFQYELQSSIQQQNMSNLSYSQSLIHEQSSIYQNDAKRMQEQLGSMQHHSLVGERILPQIEEEDERFQQVYDKDPILQKLFQEKNGLEEELRKWELILQDLNKQASLRFP